VSTTILNSGNIARAVYEPSSESIRVNLVGSGSPVLPNVVRLSDGTDFISSTVIGPDRALDVNVLNNIELTISHLDDSIRLGDGTNYITSTVSGAKRSLDVNMVGSGSFTGSFTQTPTGPTVTAYNTASLVAAATTTVVSYTTPALVTSYIQKVYISGEQVGTYEIKLNSTTIIKTRTSVTRFSETIDLNTGSSFGVIASPGDIVSVLVTNSGSQSGNFDVTIQVMEN
jgi:hypothetical protein